MVEFLGGDTPTHNAYKFTAVAEKVGDVVGFSSLLASTAKANEAICTGMMNQLETFLDFCSCPLLVKAATSNNAA